MTAAAHVHVFPPQPSVSGRESPYCRIRWHDDRHSVSGTTSFHIGDSTENSSDRPLGPHANWLWDGDQLEVRGDRYGLQPLYYYTRANEICISTSIDTLLKHGAPTELDEAALAVYLRWGSFLDTDTPFRHILAVPPDARIVWRNGALDVQGEFVTRPPMDLPESDAIDTYIELFRQAMKRRLVRDRRVVLPLSGGRDSRHILLELCRNGHPPDLAVTIDLQSCGDADAARLVARACNINHIVIPETRRLLPQFLRLQEETSFNLARETAFFALADYLKESDDVIYDGIGGDVLSAGLFLTEDLLEAFVSRNWDKAANIILLETPERDPLKGLFQEKQYRKFALQVAVERLSRELRRHQDAANPVGSFVFWNRTRRSIASVPLCLLRKNRHLLLTPYLDDELFDFLSALPARLFLDHQFHTRAILRAFPSTRSIPFAEKKRGFVRHADNCKLAWQLAVAVLPGSQYLSMSYLMPRLFRVFIDPGYRRAVEWFGPMAAYIKSLESLAPAEQAADSVVWQSSGPFSNVTDL